VKSLRNRHRAEGSEGWTWARELAKEKAANLRQRNLAEAKGEMLLTGEELEEVKGPDQKLEEIARGVESKREGPKGVGGIAETASENNTIAREKEKQLEGRKEKGPNGEGLTGDKKTREMALEEEKLPHSQTGRKDETFANGSEVDSMNMDDNEREQDFGERASMEDGKFNFDDVESPRSEIEEEVEEIAQDSEDKSLIFERKEGRLLREGTWEMETEQRIQNDVAKAMATMWDVKESDRGGFSIADYVLEALYKRQAIDQQAEASYQTALDLSVSQYSNIKSKRYHLIIINII
jgi:hypothetical protein